MFFNVILHKIEINSTRVIPICIHSLRQFTESLILTLAPSTKTDSGKIIQKWNILIIKYFIVYKNYYDQSRFKNDRFRRFNSVEKKNKIDQKLKKRQKSTKINNGSNYRSWFVQNRDKFYPSGIGKSKSWASLSLQRGRSLINRFHARHIRIPKSVKTPGRSGPRQPSLTATTK